MRRRLLSSVMSRNPFIISVKTDNTGTSGSTQFTIPTNSGTYTYNYSVTTSEHSLTGQTGDVTLTFAGAGTYDVEISGDFPQIYFNDLGDKLKILDVKQWGSISWKSFGAAFRGTNNLTTFSATDTPNLSSVTSFLNCFANSTGINADFSGWDMSNVTILASMFFNADAFRGIGLDTWDINQVTSFVTFMFGSTGLSTANYDALLIAWDAQGTMSYSGTADFGGSQYTLGGAAETARTSLISKWGGITDGGGI